ncbi:MAG: MFS transporter [Gammaproteobacteria bacterium]
MKTESTHQRLFMPIYMPALLLGIPAQASLVLLPLYVLHLGESVAAAAAIVGVRALGMMFMDIPAGMLAARFGDKRLMMAAIAAVTVSHCAFALSNQLWLLYAIAFFYGAGGSSFLLARMSYLTDTLSASERGRAIAMIAGSMRISALIGPALGAVLAQRVGYDAAFYAGTVLAASSWFCVKHFASEEEQQQTYIPFSKVLAIGRDYSAVFLTAGTGAVLFMLLRSARTVMVPLVGSSLSLDTETIGLIVSISAAVDVAMFYPSGLIMDKFGRRATAVPSSILFTLALALLAFADDYSSLLAVAVFLGFANGLSTGIVMTLGTDLAPPTVRAGFLGIWRLLTDFGTSAGPMAVGGIVAIAPLSTAAVSISAIGAVGCVIVYRYVEETLHR